MADRLQSEFEYYLRNQAAFVEKYNGKVVVLKDQEVIGVFDAEEEAIKETQKKHELGTFLVQRVEPGSKAYTQTFHSRVTFA